MKLLASSAWRWYLAVAGLIIVAITIYYTQYLADRLAKIEENYTKIYAMASETLNEAKDEYEEQCDTGFEAFIVQNNTTVPGIMVNPNNEIVFAVNMGEDTTVAFEDAPPMDTAFLEKTLQQWIDDGAEPIPSGYGTLIYLGKSQILGQLRYFPVWQFFLIGAFILLGYLGINAARRAEQNRVWVGLAKETAHQLGTPISAIIGWLEHLKMNYEGQEDIEMVTEEMGKDVHRLEMVANRFSKIGADPDLKSVNIYEQLYTNYEYMAIRAPRKVSLEFPDPAELPPAEVQLNPLLFDWVIENLLRNAIDALEGKGEITAEVQVLPKQVKVLLSDTGKGIPAGKQKTVFEPGYTTKQRGWGLGLSLAKRIIEQYHKGKIYVAKSEVGVGTTFAIELPKVSA
ncbi:MAG: HAMP domain-containing sensor histidine kinase [Bacteroidota bacterium]